jgi:hypothetical protein
MVNKYTKREDDFSILGVNKKTEKTGKKNNQKNQIMKKNRLKF